LIPVTKITKVVEFVKFSSKAIIVTVVVFYIIESGIGQKLGLFVVNRVLNVAQTIIKSIRTILKGDEKYITIEIPQILDNDNLPLAIRIPTSGKVNKVTHVFSWVKPILSLLPLLTHLFDNVWSDHTHQNDEGLIRSIIRESQRTKRSTRG
jgi:hypothetical protein